MKQIPERRRYLYWFIDVLFVITVASVVFSELPKSFFPSSANALISYDSILSVYFVSVLEILVLVILISEREYSLLKIIFICAFIYLAVNLVICLNGILSIHGSISENDILELKSARRSFFFIISKLFPSLGIDVRIVISESIYSLYDSVLKYKETFGAVLILFFIYKDSFEKLFKLFLIGISISIAVIFLYECIEIPSLFGNSVATGLLEIINPHLYEIGSLHGWWPPLLWSGQLRGTFAEPSFFSYYLGFAVAYLFYVFVTRTNVLSFVALLLTEVVVFWTNARSGIMLLIGLTILNVFLQLICQRNVKKALCLVLVILLAYFASLSYGAYQQSLSRQNMVDSETDNHSQVLQTIASVANPDARSNTSRYSYIKTTAAIGADYPLLGVGPNYLGQYIAEQMSRLNKQSHEMKVWIQTQNDVGILNNSFPQICEYTWAFASGGVLGLCLVVFFVFYACVQYLIILIKYGFRVFDNKTIMVLSMLAVIVVWGLSNTFMKNYLYIITLAFALCDIRRIKNRMQII